MTNKFANPECDNCSGRGSKNLLQMDDKIIDSLWESCGTHKLYGPNGRDVWASQHSVPCGCVREGRLHHDYPLILSSKDPKKDLLGPVWMKNAVITGYTRDIYSSMKPVISEEADFTGRLSFREIGLRALKNAMFDDELEDVALPSELLLVDISTPSTSFDYSEILFDVVRLRFANRKKTWLRISPTQPLDEDHPAFSADVLYMTEGWEKVFIEPSGDAQKAASSLSVDDLLSPSTKRMRRKRKAKTDKKKAKGLNGKEMITVTECEIMRVGANAVEISIGGATGWAPYSNTSFRKDAYATGDIAEGERLPRWLLNQNFAISMEELVSDTYAVKDGEGE